MKKVFHHTPIFSFEILQNKEAAHEGYGFFLLGYSMCGRNKSHRRLSSPFIHIYL